MSGKNNRCLLRVISAGIFLGLLLFPALNWAGNKKYVEKQVENLDNLNKKIIGDFSDIPKNSTIKYKAIVTESSNGPRVKIIEKQIEMTPTPKSKPPIKRPKTAKKNAELIKTKPPKTEME